MQPEAALAQLHRQRFLMVRLGIDEDVTRRDSLHAIINSLPDPNYATLRALILVCKCT